MNILSKQVTQEEFVTTYIDLWVGAFSLTDKEKKVIVEIVKIYLELQSDGLNSKYINKLLFSTDSRKRVRDFMSISEPGLNNYFTQLKEKQVIIEEDKELYINPVLIPRTEITFKFKII